MTRSPMHRGRLLAIAIVAVSCTTYKTSDDSRAVPGKDTYVEPVPESGDEQVSRTPGPDEIGGPYSKRKSGTITNKPTLEAPVRLYEKVPDDVLARYLNALNFDAARDNGELAWVRCKAGGGDGCGVLLYIQPEIGMNLLRFEKVPPKGMVVARIINYSATHRDSTWEIPPSTRAYWYVDHYGSGLRSRVFIRTANDTAGNLKFLGKRDTLRTFQKCYHTKNDAPAMAKFRKCVPYATSSTIHEDVGPKSASNPFIHPVSFSPTPLPSAQAEATALTDTELWVKCAQACCIAGP